MQLVFHFINIVLPLCFFKNQSKNLCRNKNFLPAIVFSINGISEISLFDVLQNADIQRLSIISSLLPDR